MKTLPLTKNDPIKIGTIAELDGSGYEILVDAPTRSIVLARFYDGRLLLKAAQTSHTGEETLVVES